MTDTPRPPTPMDDTEESLSTVEQLPATPHKRGTPVGGGLLDPRQLWRSLPDALRKLDPRTLWRNPVMLIVEIGAVFTTILAIADPSVFAWLITVWLWLTALFANVAEAVAEGRGKAQAAALRKTRTDTIARVPPLHRCGRPRAGRRGPTVQSG